MENNIENILEDLKEKAKSIYEDNKELNKIISDVKEKMEDNEVLSSLTNDMKIAIEMIIDWKDGKYRDLSPNTIILTVAGLLYIVSPVKILPKPLKGSYLDDIIIIGYILKKLKDELEIYKQWKYDNGLMAEDNKTIYIDI